MKTRALLTFAMMLLLAGAIAPVEGGPVQVASAQPEATACSRVECMRECQKAGGTLDECSERCRDASNPGRKTRSDPYCVRECQATGHSRQVCEQRCSSTESTPSKPEFPGPTRPRPGT